MPFFIYLEGNLEEQNVGCFATYWFNGDDLADAISLSSEHASSELGLKSTRIESVLYDDEQDAPENLVETEHPSLSIFEELQTWELSDEDSDFMFPIGVVPSNSDGPYETEEIQEGYFCEHSDNLHSVTVVVDGRRVIEISQSIVNILPSKDGLEIQIKNHWNDQNVTEVWLAKPEFTGDAILQFLLTNEKDLISNGGVEIAVYSRKEKTTLRFTDHKIFRYYSKDKSYLDSFVKGVAMLEFSELQKGRNIAHKYHHHHFTPKGAGTPEELKTKLSSLDFKKVSERVEASG